MYINNLLFNRISKIDLATGIIRAKITNRGKDDLYNFSIEVDNGTITTITPISPSATTKVRQGRSIYLKGYQVNLGNLNTIRIIPNSCPQKIAQLKVNNIDLTGNLVLNLHMHENNGSIAYDSSQYVNNGIIHAEGGRAESGTTNSLTDSDKTWTVNEWVGRNVTMTFGTGYGQSRTITWNNETTLQVTPNWATSPDSSSYYFITCGSCSELWTTGKFGKALQFNKSTEVAVVPTSTSLNITEEITLELWVKDRAVKKYMGILVKHTDGATARPYAFEVDGNYKFQFVITNSSGNSVDVVTPSVPSANVWYHVVGTYDSSLLRLYIDGVEVANEPQSGPILIVDYPLYVGMNHPIYMSAWDGIIDEVRIYNRALTADEIIDLAS